MNIDIIPTGGLCNRMRAIASAYEISQAKNCKLKVIWNKYDGLNAQFSDLFSPISEDNIEIVDTTKWLYNINRRADYLKRLISLKIAYNKVFFQPDIKDNLTENLKIGANLIISGAPLCEKYEFSRLFTPTNDIKEKIQSTVNKFKDNTIGIHIRRTDNTESIRVSTTEAFHKCVSAELNADPNTMFYLATDDNCIKEEFIKTYGNHIITTVSNTDRNSLEGMLFAVYDLYCLSSTKKIIGSYYSSYTQVAAQIGHIKIEYARK